MKNTIFIICILFSNTIFSQTRFDQFKELFKKNDTTKTIAFLKEWEKITPNDPEFFVSSMNYYFSNAKKEILSFDKSKDGELSLNVEDEKGKKYFINSNMGFDKALILKTLNYANKGIEEFPDRLDIRFGKCYILKQIQDYSNFNLELNRTIEYSRINSNKWILTENEKPEDGKAYMLSTIYEYQTELYETGDDALLNNIITIGKSTLKYYPNEIEILSITAVSLLLSNKFTEALEYLKIAEKLNPKDIIVMSNIAQVYVRQGDKTNAIKYYEQILKLGDLSEIENAKKELAKLIN